MVDRLYIGGWSVGAGVWTAVRAHTPGEVIAWWDCLDGDLGALGRMLTALDPVRAGPGQAVTVVGWSLGGQLALAAARRWPQAVARLVLLATPARFCAAPDYPGADARALRAMRWRLGRERAAVVEDFWQRCAAPAPVATAASWRVAATAGVPGDALTAGLDHLARTDLRAQLPAIGAPTHVVHGNADQVVPLAAGRALAAGLPKARLTVVGGGGHALPCSHPEAIARLITAVEPSSEEGDEEAHE